MRNINPGRNCKGRHLKRVAETVTPEDHRPMEAGYPPLPVMPVLPPLPTRPDYEGPGAMVG